EDVTRPRKLEYDGRRNGQQQHIQPCLLTADGKVRPQTVESATGVGHVRAIVATAPGGCHRAAEVSWTTDSAVVWLPTALRAGKITGFGGLMRSFLRTLHGIAILLVA